MNQGLFFGQLVIGPAGSGKSTYCHVMQEMAQTLKRNIVIFNLDPAAQYNQYRCDFDIKQLITLEDAMQEMQLGPNGALFFCLEFLIQNQSWFQQKLNQLIGSDDYVLFDCPGQIELYSDQEVFREFVKILQNYGFSLVSMYMMDINFIGEKNKFISGMLQALSVQITLQLPAMTVLTKCDLIKEEQKISEYLNFFSMDNFDQDMHKHGNTLYEKIRAIYDSHDTVSIRPLNLKDQDSIRQLLAQADHSIQYDESLEPKDDLYQKTEESMKQNMMN